MAAKKKTAKKKSAKKKVVAKNPVGRPTKYNESFCHTVIEAMKRGLSKEAAAAKCGISEDTFYRWIHKYPEFSEAVKEGSRLSLLFWESAGIKGMTGQIAGFNATTWIFNMKNRHGWKDRQDITTNDRPVANEWIIQPVKNNAD